MDNIWNGKTRLLTTAVQEFQPMMYIKPGLPSIGH
jgi:hypothetical protein